jgi:hypothetical protein
MGVGLLQPCDDVFQGTNEFLPAVVAFAPRACLADSSPARCPCFANKKRQFPLLPLHFRRFCPDAVGAHS